MTREIAVYISLPLVSGLIGWFTNRVAVRMLFRPYRPVRVFGLSIQGLIPRRRSDLARSIGETVERELISHGDLQAAAASPEFSQRLARVLRERLDEFLEKTLGAVVVDVFLRGEIVSRLKERLVREVQRLVPDAVDMMLRSMEAHLSFRTLVQQKVEAFEMNRFETLIYSIASRELVTIEVLGGVLGCAVGLAQVGIVVLLG